MFIRTFDEMFTCPTISLCGSVFVSNSVGYRLIINSVKSIFYFIFYIINENRPNLSRDVFGTATHSILECGIILMAFSWGTAVGTIVIAKAMGVAVLCQIRIAPSGLFWFCVVVHHLHHFFHHFHILLYGLHGKVRCYGVGRKCA